MLTADSITDDQIRDLLEFDEIDLVQFHQATDDIVGWVDVGHQNARSAARARCAEILNARQGANSMEPDLTENTFDESDDRQDR